VTDARQKYADAVERVAAVLGARVRFTVKNGHLAGEIVSPPDVLDDSETLENLVDLLEIASAHICPACGVDSGFVDAVELPGGELEADCLGCGSRVRV
jgi:hypothetical protein